MKYLCGGPQKRKNSTTEIDAKDRKNAKNPHKIYQKNALFIIVFSF